MQGHASRNENTCAQCGTSFYRAAYRKAVVCSRRCYYLRQQRPLADRFWEKVDRRDPADCWPWLASLDGHGYGHFRGSDGRAIKAHRLSYLLTVGPIPEGLLVRHRCQTTNCVNPAHLTVGTYSENLIDRYRAGRPMVRPAVQPKPPLLPAWLERVCPHCGLIFRARRCMVAKGKVKYCSYPCAVAARYGTSEAERFWQKVDRRGECWVWTGALHAFGYGVARLNGKQTTAHRVAWYLTNGPIPAELMVCHRCDNPPCVRPDHLFLGTTEDNMRDCATKGRLPCGESHFLRQHPERRLLGERVPGAILNPDKVRLIREKAAAGQTQEKIAAEFGTTQTNVGCIVRRVTWKHVP